MPKYQVELSDGRKFEVEADGPPSVSDLMPHIEEQDFQAWAKKNEITDADSPESFYDYRSAYRADAKRDASGHWPSDFKKPGHPNEIVGGFNTRTGERVKGTPRVGEQELVKLGWDAETAKRLAQTPDEETLSPWQRYKQGLLDLPTAIYETVNQQGKAGAAALRSGDIHKFVTEGPLSFFSQPLAGIADTVQNGGMKVEHPLEEAASLTGLPVEQAKQAVKERDYPRLAGQATAVGAALLAPGLRSRISAGARSAAPVRSGPVFDASLIRPEFEARPVYTNDASGNVAVKQMRVPNRSGLVTDTTPAPRPSPPVFDASKITPPKPTPEHPLTQALQSALDEVRSMREQPEVVSGQPESTVTPGGRPAVGPEFYEQQNIGDRVRSYEQPKVETASETAPVKARPPKSVEDFADMMKKKGAQIDGDLDTGKAPADTAAEIETFVQQLTDHLKNMRTRFGAGRMAAAIFNTGEGGMTRKAQADVLRRLSGGEPSRMPQVAEEAINARKGEKGAINPKLTATLGAGAAGAAIGGSFGDDKEDRVTNAIIGAGTGAALVPLLAHLHARGYSKSLQNYVYTSVLSSPTSAIKAYLGGNSGAIAVALEAIAAGDTAKGTGILRELFSPQHVQRIVDGFKSTENTGRVDDSPTFLGRIFEAANKPALEAMERNGVPHNEAVNATLSGIPTTQIGKDTLGLLSRYFTLRLATSLFPRVGIQVLERGLERSPIGLGKVSGLNEGVSGRMRVARAAMGTAAGAGAYAVDEDIPDWAKPFVIAASGMYALPVGTGMAVAQARRKGRSGATAAIEAFGQNLPFPQYGPVEAIKQHMTGATLVPNIVRDVARASDPYERDTSGDFFGRTKAKVPGLRETLPVKGRAVNIAGKPNEDRSSALTRFMSSANPQSQPMKDVPAHVVSELQRLDVQINAPAFDKSIEVNGRKVEVPPDAAERARSERRQHLVPIIEKLLDSSAYQSADDASKKRRLEAVIRRTEAADSARARANVIRVLRSQGAFRRDRTTR